MNYWGSHSTNIRHNLSHKEILMREKSFLSNRKRYEMNKVAFGVIKSEGASFSDKELKKDRPLVKMCCVTSAKDAAMALEAGADFIGMIVRPNSKRAVSVSVAKEISKVAREYGPMPVGVFVDDDCNDPSQIITVAFGALQTHHQIIYVLNANEDGELLNQIPEEECWVLVDSAKGGRGKGFNWTQFKLPTIRSKHGWLLAGGMKSENVCESLALLKPHGVDVRSGICASDDIQKDQSQISLFITAVQSMQY